MRGFTLIEILVVIAIILITTVVLITNVGRQRTDLDQEASRIIAQVRETQAEAVSGARFNNKPRCGYGVIGATPSTYSIFTGPDSSAVDCSAQNRNYESGIDSWVRDVTLFSGKIEFKQSQLGVFFRDIFFEPPDPKTYVNNNATLNASPATIIIGVKNSDCTATPKDCRVVCVYTSGNVEARSYVAGNLCP
jgi:prepilin-type N-terminal cleavage/methylation domain-containing protein